MNLSPQKTEPEKLESLPTVLELN